MNFARFLAARSGFPVERDGKFRQLAKDEIAALPGRVQVDAEHRFTGLEAYKKLVASDGAANDGLFGASVPPFANGTVIEFYVQAADAQNNVRTWPAAARQADSTFAQTANALYQVDDNLAPPSAATADRITWTENSRSFSLSALLSPVVRRKKTPAGRSFRLNRTQMADRVGTGRPSASQASRTSR